MHKIKRDIIYEGNEYKNVFSISPPPTNEALKNIIINKYSTVNNENKCIHVLIDPTDSAKYLNSIETLTTYLVDNSISIDYELTKLFNHIYSNLIYFINV